jgi:predicted nuclease of restriction endonuclease-like (RecB) superfamily
MKKKNSELSAVESGGFIDENALFERVAAIIENRKARAYARVNSENTLMFWEIGVYINTAVLKSKRADYGKKILPALSAKLVLKYGKNFSERNLYRKMLFAERFSNAEILPPLAAKLSWSHIIELLPFKSDEARLYYANEVALRNLGTKELRRQISRKAFERRETANLTLTEQSSVPFNVFKDPYLLDTFGLKENYLEADLEKAILADIESFILKFGHGFTFADRQKRMIIDGEDIVIDLLFYR